MAEIVVERTDVGDITYMDARRDLEYVEALRRLNLREVAEETGRGYSTLQAYLSGRRRVTEPAVRELVAFLRRRASRLQEVADRLQRGEENDGPEA